MGDVINLHRARKKKARDVLAKAADANRVKFGRTKAEKTLTDAKSKLENRKLDGHRIDE
jgi:Domain of unknown function (DUF4169)